MSAYIPPSQAAEELAQLGTMHLEQVIAIDSQSDEASETVPSTEGQRVLSDHLRRFFEGLGYTSEQDDSANLIVRVPATAGSETAPRLALMVHMDTSEGTEAVSALERVPAWDGSRVRYPQNDRLHVSADRYSATRDFVGEDLLHGPGRAPIGLDDKLGMCELMTLARVLQANPTVPHGELFLVFRPDEEIGRMAAVEGLADLLVAKGVSRGYTVDGIAPFEVNVENFNASRARVRVPSRYAEAGPRRARLDLRVDGVKSHGATAKAEGYLNATLIVTRALQALADSSAGIFPIGFETDTAGETSADVSFALHGADPSEVAAARDALLGALSEQTDPAGWRGACWEVVAETPIVDAPPSIEPVFDLIARFLEQPHPTPLLSEASEGAEGYSNPYAISAGAGGGCQLDFRLRDFDPAALRAREAHVVEVAADCGLDDEAVTVTQQYINMGPALADYPELVEWAVAALEPLGHPARRYPIRGGTGVDPFLARGIGIANLGTGYFAPESEKELTSRQSIARHSLWLINLVQQVARA